MVTKGQCNKVASVGTTLHCAGSRVSTTRCQQPTTIVKHLNVGQVFASGLEMQLLEAEFVQMMLQPSVVFKIAVFFAAQIFFIY